jgi:DNA primase
MIKQSSIENLKHQLDIVDVLGKYLDLKKAGANYKCNCPFHGEKTPSFTISPAKQIYHCFGCNVTGDSISFVMEYEKLSYPEAIEKLADEYNFKLDYDKNIKKSNIQILEQVNQFFVKKLDNNSIAIDYLKNRGLNLETIEKFKIGFAPSSQELIQTLNHQYINIKDAIEYGVIAQGDNGIYSRFIDRITFPILNNSGKICGFGGRTISNHPAKYINSPTTKSFNKSKIFYGYYEAKDQIFKSNQIIITEGYLDVIMLHQAGFKNTVATCGTALTIEHIPLIKKTKADVILSFDGDSAGISAAFKASNLLIQQNINSKVVIFKDNLDPADMVLSGKLKELDELFKNAIPSIKFCLNTIVKNYDIHTPEQKQLAFNETNQFLKTLTPFLQSEYKSYLSSLLNIEPTLIKTNRYQQSSVQSIQQKEDLAELSIIKTLINIPTLIDSILDFCSEEMFNIHYVEFQLLLQNNLNHEKLVKIDIRDDIAILNEDELIQSVILIQKKYYERLKNNPQINSFDFDKQLYIKKKINESIQLLDKSQLVKYENFFE